MNSGQHASQNGSGFLGGLVKLVALIAIVVALSYGLRTFVFQPYEIPSGSMEETIQAGDMVFAEKLSYYFRDVQQGDIITFHDPLSPGRELIKRVVAVGGQTVDINDEDGLVYVDGVALDEPYTNGLPTYTLDNSVANVTFPYTVPEGQLWVMGDNRTNSQDSRYFGSIEESSVTGHGVLIYWPLDHFGPLE